jgi:hypothetical protein
MDLTRCVFYGFPAPDERCLRYVYRSVFKRWHGVVTVLSCLSGPVGRIDIERKAHCVCSEGHRKVIWLMANSEYHTGLLRLPSQDYLQSQLPSQHTRVQNTHSILFHNTPQRAAQPRFISSTTALNLFSPSSSMISQSQYCSGVRSVVVPSGWASMKEGCMD